MPRRPDDHDDRDGQDDHVGGAGNRPVAVDPPPAPVPWGVLDAVAALIAALVVIVLAGGAAVELLRQVTPTALIDPLALVVSLLLLGASVLAYVRLRYPGAVTRLFGSRRPNRRDVALGVGGGVVVEGRCLIGPNAIAGEWGHNPLPWPDAEELPGPECYCGRRGCIETYLSGPGLERDHAERTGERLSSRAIVARAHETNAEAAATLQRYHDRLGRALASVVNVLDPDVVVLGGGLSNVPGLAEAARQAVSRYVFSDTFNTAIVQNWHGDSSGVRGAAWLWPG